MGQTDTQSREAEEGKKGELNMCLPPSEGGDVDTASPEYISSTMNPNMSDREAQMLMGSMSAGGQYLNHTDMMLNPPPRSEAGSLRGLTPSQRSFVRGIQAIEASNPEATPDDIAMAASMVIWDGLIWDSTDGKAADVTTGLVNDYKGGSGYKDVNLSDKQRAFIRNNRQVTDKHGTTSGVSHAFPAVAGQAGYDEDESGARARNRAMVTYGGDTLQETARTMGDIGDLAGDVFGADSFEGVKQAFEDYSIKDRFPDEERMDNERAVRLAIRSLHSYESLSASFVAMFKAENDNEGLLMEQRTFREADLQ